MVKAAELDLNADPKGPEVRHLLMQIDLRQVSVERPAADRFVYTLRFGSWEITVPERELTPELDQVVRIVLNRGG